MKISKFFSCSSDTLYCKQQAKKNHIKSERKRNVSKFVFELYVEFPEYPGKKIIVENTAPH